MADFWNKYGNFSEHTRVFTDSERVLLIACRLSNPYRREILVPLEMFLSHEKTLKG